MAEAAKQWANEFDQASINATRVDELALKKTESYMKHSLDYEDVRNTITRLMDDDEFFANIATCLKSESRGRLFDLIQRVVEDEVFLFKTTEAQDEIYHGRCEE